MSSNKAILAQIRRDLLKTIPDSVKKEIAKADEKSAKEFAAQAKALAPEGTGDLAASIRVEDGDDALSKRVVAGGKEAPHATFVEFGTPDAAADPFFWAVWNLMRKRRESRRRRALNAALKDFRS